MSQLPLLPGTPAHPTPLPTHLERRCLTRAEPRAGELVLVWLRVAVRGHENPALDAGRIMAATLGLPLLVYHAVSERYPHASDRHHAFILQGAQNLSQELHEQGLRGVFHVERPGHRGPVLKALATRAALVITDAMPLKPLSSWTNAVAEHAPLWQMDCSCVVPMSALKRQPTRAFAFRKATLALRQDMLDPWPQVDAHTEAFHGELGFEPVDIERADLATLIAACEIDHSVGPVADTLGGSKAGYARWEHFRDGPLKHYARQRNDAARPRSVSRLSAYLHYGHISPFRIAREAQAMAADKFLDELLVWRELAWHHCHHAVSDPRAWTALPTWARETLEAHHESTPLPLEALELGQTDSALWNLAQKSLLIHGELHNNLRMTWGKALLQWSRSPRQTLARLFELNDRYALDGRDPASVAGLTWCLGAMDRPFSPPEPPFGSVRSRSLAHHARRLDLERYGAWVSRASLPNTPSILVVGAGLAGAAAAHTLARTGAHVQVCDKSRGAGGRMSTRRNPQGAFDHGAQSFTARDPRFVRQVKLWEAAGAVAPWPGKLGQFDGVLSAGSNTEPRFVAAPAMNALPKRLLQDLTLHTQTHVQRIAREGQQWRVETETGELGLYDRVILTIPAPQALALLGTDHAFSTALQNVHYAPCWAAMLHGRAGLPWDGIRCSSGPLAWAGRQDTLPDRGGQERWVLHASPEWSQANLEADKNWVAEQLAQAFAELGGGGDHSLDVHRWRYSLVTQAMGKDHLQHQGLLYAGDGCLGGRIEAAWLSGVAAAGAVLAQAGHGL